MTQHGDKAKTPGKRGVARYRSTDWLAGRWDMHPESIRRLIREGKVPAVKRGRSWVIAVADVEAIEQAWPAVTEAVTVDDAVARWGSSTSTCLSPTPDQRVA